MHLSSQSSRLIWKQWFIFEIILVPNIIGLEEDFDVLAVESSVTDKLNVLRKKKMNMMILEYDIDLRHVFDIELEIEE